jgi:hypothetical protein
MRIRGDALELAFRLVLSCPCDVTHEQELRVFEYLQRSAPGDVVDCAPVLAAFEADGTPFHQLAEFTSWLAPADGEAIIEREHILRLHGSLYHWEHAASTLPNASRTVTSISRFLLAHLLLPARLTTGADGEPAAEYVYDGGSVRLEHLFLPPELADPTAGHASSDDVWLVHFAAVLGRLTPAEVRLLGVLQAANPQLLRHREQVASIDYADFELQGDNRAFCRRRHAPFWGDAQR